METQVTNSRHALRTFPPLILAFVFSVLTTLTWAATQSFYKDSKSVFTISRDHSRPGCGSVESNEKSVDVAVVEFDRNGSLVDNDQLKRALACISEARKNRNGTVVMVFVHGWRHDASWTDDHFKEFRTVLLSLALREAERSRGKFRRVIGIYFGWPGGYWGNFSDSYEAAQRIGNGSAIKNAIQEIVATTKEPSGNDELGSPVILAGHSMGALIFQTAYSSLLATGGVGPRVASPAEQRRCVRVHEGDQVVAFPDLVLLLNSATDSQITSGIIKQLKERKLSKTVACGGILFRAPLFISASSKKDRATAILYPAWTGGKTDGNDVELINYELARTGNFKCEAIKGVPDNDQSWHCLRQPAITNDQVVSINIDLPQAKDPRHECHVRYQFARLAAKSDYVPFWVFQVPGELVEDHGDIFNGRARLLIMALVQLSGATMSVHENYGVMFEPGDVKC